MISNRYIPTKFDDNLKSKVLMKRNCSKSSNRTDIVRKKEENKTFQISFLEKINELERFGNGNKENNKEIGSPNLVK